MNEIERLWALYEQYKETAEQYEFPMLLLYDMTLIPQYNQLRENYDEEKAKLLIKNLKFVLNKFTVSI